MKIGNIDIPNNIFLAPMAGVTDVSFRRLCKEMGAGLTYTEMVSAKALMYENDNTISLLEIAGNEKPVAVQLFGSDPAILAKEAYNIQEQFDIIDINMGCPAPKITNNGEGSALMKSPELIEKIVKEVVNAVSVPVTVKIRKGFTKEEVNAIEIAKIAESNGASAVAVHGRTRDQFYSGKADWDIIRAVKESISIPVIGNGDIFTPEAAREMLNYTECDAVMVARGAEGNPWIFKRINHYLKTGELINGPTTDERISLALRHAKMLIENKGEYIGTREMRKHVIWYTKGIPNATKIRNELGRAESIEELEKLLFALK